MSILRKLFSPTGFALAIVCFALPFVSVSCSSPVGSIGADVSGVNLFAGTDPSIETTGVFAKGAVGENDDDETTASRNDTEPDSLDDRQLGLAARLLAAGSLLASIVALVLSSFRRSRRRSIAAITAGVAACVGLVGMVLTLRADILESIRMATLSEVSNKESFVTAEMVKSMVDVQIRYGFWLTISLLASAVLGLVLEMVHACRVGSGVEPCSGGTTSDEDGGLSRFVSVNGWDSSDDHIVGDSRRQDHGFVSDGIDVAGAEPRTQEEVGGCVEGLPGRMPTPPSDLESLASPPVPGFYIKSPPAGYSHFGYPIRSVAPDSIALSAQVSLGRPGSKVRTGIRLLVLIACAALLGVGGSWVFAYARPVATKTATRARHATVAPTAPISPAYSPSVTVFGSWPHTRSATTAVSVTSSAVRVAPTMTRQRRVPATTTVPAPQPSRLSYVAQLGHVVQDGGAMIQPERGAFLLLYLTVENVSTAPISVSGWNLELKDSRGLHYDCWSGRALSWSFVQRDHYPSFTSETLQPGELSAGYIFFDVPKGVPLTAKYDDTFGSGRYMAWNIGAV